MISYTEISKLTFFMYWTQNFYEYCFFSVLKELTSIDVNKLLYGKSFK